MKVLLACLVWFSFGFWYWNVFNFLKSKTKANRGKDSDNYL